MQVRLCVTLMWCWFSSGGGTRSIHDGGGSDVFFWVENLHARYFFGVKRSVTYYFRS